MRSNTKSHVYPSIATSSSPEGIRSDARGSAKRDGSMATLDDVIRHTRVAGASAGGTKARCSRAFA